MGDASCVIGMHVSFSSTSLKVQKTLIDRSLSVTLVLFLLAADQTKPFPLFVVIDAVGMCIYYIGQESYKPGARALLFRWLQTKGSHPRTASSLKPSGSLPSLGLATGRSKRSALGACRGPESQALQHAPSYLLYVY